MVLYKKKISIKFFIRSFLLEMLSLVKSLESQIKLVADLGSRMLASDALVIDSQVQHMMHLLGLLEEELEKRESTFQRALNKTKVEQENLESQISFLESSVSRTKETTPSTQRSSTDEVRKRLGLSSRAPSQLDELSELRQKLRDQMAHLHNLRKPPPRNAEHKSADGGGGEEEEDQHLFDPLSKLVFRK